MSVYQYFEIRIKNKNRLEICLLSYIKLNKRFYGFVKYSFNFSPELIITWSYLIALFPFFLELPYAQWLWRFHQFHNKLQHLLLILAWSA